MKILLVVGLVLVSGCATIGQKLRDGACGRTELERSIARAELAREGIKIEVDCDFKKARP